MSKELEILEHLRKGVQYINQDESPAFISQYEEDLDKIENALIEYEMERTLRIRLENINYELVREKQENEKKIKAFEIIKENLIFSLDESESNKSCLTIGVKVDKNHIVVIYQTFDKEKIDLLKEVLL